MLKPRDLPGDANAARWQSLVATWGRRRSQTPRNLCTLGLMGPSENVALRRQLAEMFEEDQRLRQRWMAEHRALDAEGKAALWQQVAEVDHRNTAALKAIIAEHGWPGRSLVGEGGTDMAWAIAQHADDDPAFQRAVLARMEPLLGTGEIEPSQHAYLHDRVAVAEGRPQRFGTQFSDGVHPAPIEDEAHVDDRRASVGLSSMAAYQEEMRQINASKS